MKRIIILLVFLAIVVFGITQYLRYKKFDALNTYDYKVAEGIDTNYHNQNDLADYYTTAYSIGSLAREMWYNHGIDVLFPDKGDTQSVNASLAYNQLLAKIKYLEAKLKESKRLKGQGFDNQDIKYMEEKGVSEKNYSLHRLFEGQILKKGDRSEAVWEAQTLLVKAGCNIPIDGFFRTKRS
jgi:uncharacterized membrane protein YciS (DUF1049 family)